MYFNKDISAITPTNKEYQWIKNPLDLYSKLLNCWSIKTCTPRMRNNWSENNLTCGQCSITSFLAQDIFGGEVYGVPIKEGGYHLFNVIGDCSFDLTDEQFHGEKIEYSNKIKQERVKHFSNKEKYRRYLLLKKKLEEYK